MTLETGTPVRGDDTPVGVVRPRALGRRRRRRWGPGRIVLVTLLALFGLLVGYYLISLYQVWSTPSS